MSSDRFDNIPASAFVVLDKKGKHVATVQVKYPKDGAGTLYARCETWSDGKRIVQNGKASGYGYDKKAAALRGFEIEGHVLADHCGFVEPEAMKKAKYLLDQQMIGKIERDFRGMAEKIGFRFANWHNDDKHPKGGFYTNVYPEAGLGRLEMLGYRIIQAL